MVSYRMLLNQQIQALRQSDRGNPSPSTLRKIEDLERRRKEKRTRVRRARKDRKMMQERAEEAEANADTARDSPSMDGQPDASGDASGNDGYDDVWEGFDSPDPKMMDRDNEPEKLRLTTPEKLRLTTPDSTNPPPEGNGARGHEGGNGDSSCGVGKGAGGRLRGDLDVWTGGC